MYRVERGDISLQIKAAVKDGSIESLCGELEKLSHWGREVMRGGHTAKDDPNDLRVLVIPSMNNPKEMGVEFLLKDSTAPILVGALVNHGDGTWGMHT